MNIRDLEYLIAIDKYKHFRKAAEKCYVSQPALSSQLKKLEEYLGVQLVERTQRKVFLTSAGNEILVRAKNILMEVEAIENIATNYTDPMSQSVHIGIIPTLAPYLLPLIIKTIKKKYPKLELLLEEVQTPILLKELSEGKLDVGILAIPIKQEIFQEVELFYEPFLLAVPSEHRFGKKKQITELDLKKDLKTGELFLLEEGHCLRSQALHICEQMKVQEKKEFRGTSLETLRNMVLAGSGITLMPQLSTIHQKKEDGICYIPFDSPMPGRMIGMIFRKNTTRFTCFKALIEIIQRKLKKILPVEKERINIMPFEVENN